MYNVVSIPMGADCASFVASNLVFIRSETSKSLPLQIIQLKITADFVPRKETRSVTMNIFRKSFFSF